MAGRRQKGSKTVRGHDNTPNCSMPMTIWSFLLWPHAPLPGLSVSASNKKNLTPKPRAGPTKDGETPLPLFLCQGGSGCRILSTGFCLSPHLARAISNLRAPSAPVEHGIKGRQVAGRGLAARSRRRWGSCSQLTESTQTLPEIHIRYPLSLNG